MPLLGGLAIFAVFWGVVGYVVWFNPILGIERVANSLGALFFGSIMLLAIGILDEIRPFSPKIRLVLAALAILSVALSLPLARLTNPLGGFWTLSGLAGSALVFGWLMITTFSVKLLDGVDGLAASVVLVGAVTIGMLTLGARFYQPNVAWIAFIFSAVLLGFLVFNWPRASIFLGESGSLLIGFLLGGLAILAGSKMATALLVMAVPILDVVRVVLARLKKHQPWFLGDRNHLHFVLLDRGWGEGRVLALLVGVSAVFGLIGLFLQSYQKVLALAVLAVAFFGFAYRKKKM